MTYASQQLADALQQLVREAEPPAGYSQCQAPSNITTENLEFPEAVAEFLEKTDEYSQQTKAVSVGIY